MCVCLHNGLYGLHHTLQSLHLWVGFRVRLTPTSLLLLSHTLRTVSTTRQEKLLGPELLDLAFCSLPGSQGAGRPFRQEVLQLWEMSSVRGALQHLRLIAFHSCSSSGKQRWGRLCLSLLCSTTISLAHWIHSEQNNPRLEGFCTTLWAGGIEGIAEVQEEQVAGAQGPPVPSLGCCWGVVLFGG